MEQMQREEVTPDLVSYNTMLKSCSKAGDVPSAIRWLKEISKASLSPDVISWNCAIGACAASKPIESAKAEEFFRWETLLMFNQTAQKTI